MKTSLNNKFETKANRKNEILSIFIIAVAVFLAVVLWIPAIKTGFLGTLFENLVQGLFGTLGISIPVFLLIIAIDKLLTKEAKISKSRKNCFLLLFLAAIILVSVFYIDSNKVYMASAERGNKSSVFKAISLFWKSGMKPELISSSNVWSGGLLGGLLGFSLIVVAGRIGSIIIMIAMILALIIVVFNISYTKYLAK